jgi:Tol biopolymer transport system component
MSSTRKWRGFGAAKKAAETIVGLLMLAAPADAERSDGLLLRATGVLRYSVDRGTGMSIDLSPNGQTILFDLLGDIYALPISGGHARRLTSGMAWDSFPRFSPDGRLIAFISDRSGLDNLWVMDADGRHLRMVSTNRNVLDEDTPFFMRGPVWTPGGQEIAVRRKALRNPFSYEELWLYNSASGVGHALTGQGRPVDEPAGPTGVAFSQDGKGLVFSTRNPWDRSKTTALWYLDRHSLKRSKLAESEALLSSPTLSPSGQVLVYLATHQDENSFGTTEARRCSLVVAENGGARCKSDEAVAANLGTLRGSTAQWWTWPQGLAFMPNGKAFVASVYGKLERIDLDGTRSPIPFVAHLALGHAPLNRASVLLYDKAIPVRQLGALEVDARGKLVVFGALGDIWIKRVGDVSRLSGGPFFRFDPALSPDASRIAYAAWSEGQGGSIWVQSVSGGSATRVFTSSEHAFVPKWSNDGRIIAFLRDGANKDGPTRHQQQLMVVPADGGSARVLAGGASLLLGQGGYAPSPQLGFSADNRSVYVTELLRPSSRGDSEAARFAAWRLLRVAVDGDAVEPIADFYGLGVKAIPSPDGRWLAIQHSYNIYLLSMPRPRDSGVPERIDLTGSSVDPLLIQVTTQGGADPIWSGDSQTLSWRWMNQAYRAPLSALVRGREHPRRWTVKLKIARPIPSGRLLLTGGRTITMAEQNLTTTRSSGGSIVASTNPGLLPCADILISGRRVQKIGPCGSIHATDAQVLDVSGKTLVPGLIATHEHRNFYHSPDRQPTELSMMLAHGITTARDPGQGYEALHTQELVDGGVMTGPRWFGTLIYMFGADFYPSGQEISSELDAYNAVAKFKSAGSAVLKDYMKPHRIQRQWLSAAALAKGIRITSDQAYEWDRDVTDVLDGFTGFEHALNTCDVGPDLIGLFGRLGINYGPQLSLDPTRARAASAWLTSHRRPWWKPSGNEELDLNVVGSSSASCRAAVARDLLRAGVNVVFGRDEGLNGLEQHIALWGFSSGGMTNAEILRVGTIDGARALGVSRDLGSIEKGKIADIVVLDANPLDNIFNTLTIHQIIKDGVVYDGNTLAVVAHPVAH